MRILIFFITLIIVSFEASAEQRNALVIGNSSYKNAPLTNPKNDANDIAIKLKSLGFSVKLLIDANRRSMRYAMRNFSKKIKKGGIGLFYYAGHGIQIKGQNYLIPINADIQQEFDVNDEALAADNILEIMNDAGNRVNIVILDACRNNPIARNFRSGIRGLLRMEGPTGSLIAYSTAPGSIASDGDYRNGVYTEALLNHLSTPNITINQMFTRVRRDVLKITSNKQTPWESSSLIDDFFMVPRGITIEKREVSVKTKQITKDNNYPVKYSFFVNRIPHSANVKILNISPRYYDGIKLFSGKYHIEVSKIGYKKIRKWVLLREKDKVIIVRLKKHKLNNQHEMVHLKGGCFQIEKSDINKNKKIIKVCVDDFKIAKNEVTVGQFRQFIRGTGYETDGIKRAGGGGIFNLEDGLDGLYETCDWSNPGFEQTENHPVVCVSFRDTMKYIDWFNKKSESNYRLATEAEWEYAVRAGTSILKYWGDNSNNACLYENMYDIASMKKDEVMILTLPSHYKCDDGYPRTASVGQFAANAYGLKDMLGNVKEWVCSLPSLLPNIKHMKICFIGSRYVGHYRQTKGWSWYTGLISIQSDSSNTLNPKGRMNYIGFRLASD
jgi:formylglycine-generating enzyme required for sulfatase activity